MMLPRPQLDPQSAVPLYRQLYDFLGELVRGGKLVRGERLPATRELAGPLGLNRTTVSAAYELLETEGLIARPCGPRQFRDRAGDAPGRALDWARLLGRARAAHRRAAHPGRAGRHQLRHLAARPKICSRWTSSAPPAREVLARPGLRAILQLGSPAGYEPLRAPAAGNARARGHAGAGRRS